MRNTITQKDIDAIMASAKIETETKMDKCTVVTVQLANGFVLIASSACVDPANYNEEMGKEICLNKIKDKLWELEGYCLQKELANA